MKSEAMSCIEGGVSTSKVGGKQAKTDRRWVCQSDNQRMTSVPVPDVSRLARFSPSRPRCALHCSREVEERASWEVGVVSQKEKSTKREGDNRKGKKNHQKQYIGVVHAHRSYNPIDQRERQRKAQKDLDDAGVAILMRNKDGEEMFSRPTNDDQARAINNFKAAKKNLFYLNSILLFFSHY